MNHLIKTNHKRKSHQKKQSIPATTPTIWTVPEEVLLHVLQNLHITDLLSLSSTHSYFRDLIKQNAAVWNAVNFHGSWPTVPNMRHFLTAAEYGNIEALVKLGVAFLYNEGLPGDFEGKKITTNGERAAEMFCKVEVNTPNISPFTWLFIRPPWAVAGACCKECVFTNMKEFVSKVPDPSVHICIAKTMGILSLDEHKSDIELSLKKAVELGSQEAAFLLWTQKYCQCCRVLDSATELHSIRELREIAQSGYYEAQLVLCKRYVSEKYGGIYHSQAATFVREFVQSSEPTNVKSIYKFNELTHSMRYILMDWLVEVACMKDFSSLTLHMAVSVVDRFLQKQKTTRAKLQLLGVAAMVLCSRFLGMEIITIREAAWLTDNTYKYEDVVRMMGEITATLKGKFRIPVSLDYVDLLNFTAKSDSTTVFLAEFFSELALLQSDMGDFPIAEVAACCILFSRMCRNLENPWPAQMVQFTGYTIADLHKCLLCLHTKCFMEQAMVDHRDVVLQAVKERYADREYMSVSEIKVITKAELCNRLGIPEECPPPTESSTRFSRSSKDLIASPCRAGCGKVTMGSCAVMNLEREQAATPTMEDMKKSGVRMNESLVSGYDGDKEDEGDSFLDPDDNVSLSELLWGSSKPFWSGSQHDLSGVEEIPDCSSPAKLNMPNTTSWFTQSSPQSNVTSSKGVFTVKSPTSTGITVPSTHSPHLSTSTDSAFSQGLPSSTEKTDSSDLSTRVIIYKESSMSHTSSDLIRQGSSDSGFQPVISSVCDIGVASSTGRKVLGQLHSKANLLTSSFSDTSAKRKLSSHNGDQENKVHIISRQ